MKTALITGASSGIGMELAKIHAQKGDNLVLVARSEQKLNDLKKELESQYKITATVIALDLSNPEAAHQLFDLTEKDNIQVDYLINNAGFGDFEEFQKSDLNKAMQMIDLNTKSLTILSKLYLDGMVERKSGRIMQLASTASFQPGPLMAVYYATKHYVLAFSEAIAEELKGSGVTVTALCPGPTSSGFQNAADLGESKLVKDKKLPTSAEVARYGYKSMMNGKRVAIHGFQNKMMAFSVRFTPRNWVTALVKKLSEKG
ncbi:short-chain dehydrogenase [Marivirga tractuosa]|uniref:Short-chain dehydrogenase/reductase SDR n=1 Tax=Marivirga tractuosa (strain ATCC 23168 / DSM 4126 / NBRC 15989 / NCIMB 1408 / VKM B-1430 / H-43) TaxID=643867 RepID=E4TSQ7_MARTH|nr:SDR family oxidoreductase [Marivirga tractuosa]ADR21867.1 short-chain dehydrogenase/reductase SDR [Marivirga tractuosa DSM 4126]BDD13675.1 short-chain dehydrogenase [Marivirga tractuosa]